MQAQVADRVVDLGAAVDGRVLGVGEVYEVDAVLLRVDGALLGALLAVVDDDLVVLGAGYEGVAAGREVDAVDAVRVLAEDLGHLEAADDLVHELHGELGLLVLPRLEAVAARRGRAGVGANGKRREKGLRGARARAPVSRLLLLGEDVQIGGHSPGAQGCAFMCRARDMYINRVISNM